MTEHTSGTLWSGFSSGSDVLSPVEALELWLASPSGATVINTLKSLEQMNSFLQHHLRTVLWLHNEQHPSTNHFCQYYSMVGKAALWY